MHKEIFDSSDFTIYNVRTSVSPKHAAFPLSAKILKRAPSGDIFGQIQNIGMGQNPRDFLKDHFLILSTLGGFRSEAGQPIAFGYHTGHFELDALVKVSSQQLTNMGCLPFAAYVSDPCDGRTQGTPGMMDSLAYRNDAAVIFRRLIRSLPTCKGVLGIATCDKGLPALMMALASMLDLPCVLIPGGVTLPPKNAEDLGVIQSIGSRYARGEVTLKYARENACQSCASPGGGCHFLGTAASAQVVGEALGLSLPHSALAPSGEPVWLDMARRSARALVFMQKNGNKIKDILSPAAILNAMVVYCAFGGSTNLLIHLPAIAFAAGLERPTVQDWININKKVPRLVSVLPNGPVNYPTNFVFHAGGVPEVMLHLKEMGLLELDAKTVSGQTLGENLLWWEKSERRKKFKDILFVQQGISSDEVIFPPSRAKHNAIAGTLTFPVGNIAPNGCVIKSTAIDPSVLDQNGILRKIGPANIFTSEPTAIQAIKNGKIQKGDIMVLICIGPLGSGMEETFQVTSALRYLSWGKHVALITDGRFSGVSTGACIGHVGPEALAGGPIGKLVDGDIIEIIIDTQQQTGSVNLVGESGCDDENLSITRGSVILSNRKLRKDLKPQSECPGDTRLWAALQNISGGVWGGCVYDVDSIISKMNGQ